jgi:ElaB/YqjD/DUF883 family membrane-anchored ribosome-binding protein
METNNSQESSEKAIRTTAESVSALADRVHETVMQAQERLNDLQRDLRDKTKYAAQSTDTYVREKPWNAVGAALGIGFLAGLIIGRR